MSKDSKYYSVYNNMYSMYAHYFEFGGLRGDFDTSYRICVVKVLSLLDFSKSITMEEVMLLLIKEMEIEYIKYINSLPFEVAVVFEMKNCGFTLNEISNFLDIDKNTISKFMKFAKNRLCLN